MRALRRFCISGTVTAEEEFTAPDLRLLLRNTGPVADCCGLAGGVRPELEEALSLDSTMIGS